jgi:cytochrome c oxidase subunit 1
MDGQLYNGLVTNHAMVMFFWAAMPVLLAGLGNFLIPLMIGCDDMAFPKLNMMSYWIFFTSCVVLLLSLFSAKIFGPDAGGPAATGWTVYPPLSAEAQLAVPNQPHILNLVTGPSLLILAVALEFASMLMGGINFMVTTLNMRTKGMKMMDTPVVVWFINLASLDFMFSVGPLVAGAVMLLFDRVFNTGFYDPARGGDPILFQHLFWFFGHPEVYVVLLPALGIVAEIFSVFSRKPLFAYRMVIVAAVASAFIALIVWAHHQFIAGIDPRMATFFSITTIIISIPFALIFFAFIATLWGGQIVMKSPMLWAVGTVAHFLVGGVTGIYLGSSAFDIFAHDSYFVVAHFHYTLIPIVFFGGIAGIYMWFPKFSGKMMNEGLGKLHFWGTTIGMNMFAFPLFFSGMTGEHRRVFEYKNYPDFMQDWILQIRVIATIGAIILAASQLLLFINIFISAMGGEKAGKNPWNANTLEWVADSPPPHGNFAVYPTVNRGPYEYSNPSRSGSDFWPQNE